MPIGIDVSGQDICASELDITAPPSPSVVECFTASRPFVSTEDALRSVPRGFGVRAEPPRV